MVGYKWFQIRVGHQTYFYITVLSLPCILISLFVSSDAGMAKHPTQVDIISICFQLVMVMVLLWWYGVM